MDEKEMTCQLCGATVTGEWARWIAQDDPVICEDCDAKVKAIYERRAAQADAETETDA